MQFKHPRTGSAWDKCWESRHDHASVYPKPLFIVIHNVIGNVMYNTGLSQFTPVPFLPACHCLVLTPHSTGVPRRSLSGQIFPDSSRCFTLFLTSLRWTVLGVTEGCLTRSCPLCGKKEAPPSPAWTEGSRVSGLRSAGLATPGNILLKMGMLSFVPRGPHSQPGPSF